MIWYMEGIIKYRVFKKKIVFIINMGTLGLIDLLFL